MLRITVARLKRKLKTLTCRRTPGKVTDKSKSINQVTRGWINYYALGSMKTVMAEIDAHLRTRIRVIIWKQWKVPKKRRWGLQKLGIGKDLARLTSYCGNRYYWVVTKTCVVRAISKDVLAKAGQYHRYDKPAILRMDDPVRKYGYGSGYGRPADFSVLHSGYER